MDFFQVLHSRHSVRAFENRVVADETLRQILEAMNSAPSAGDLQAYEVVVVEDGERRERLAVAADQRFLVEAPVVLVFFVDANRSRKTYGSRGAHLYALQDTTIAAAYAQLAAQALGLGTIWVGAFDEAQVAAAVDAQRTLRPVAMIALGYPAETPEPMSRRTLDDLVARESFAAPRS